MTAVQYAAYQAVNTTTADPARIVVQLFDGAARFLRQAQTGLDRGDAKGFAYPVSRAHAIIAELSDSLDRDAGGEIAANLDRLYSFMLHHLNQALVTKNGAQLASVLALVLELRSAFEGAARAMRHGSA
jgi:flagellar secretion chaperone FliS